MSTFQKNKKKGGLTMISNLHTTVSNQLKPSISNYSLSKNNKFFKILKKFLIENKISLNSLNEFDDDKRELIYQRIIKMFIDDKYFPPNNLDNNIEDLISKLETNIIYLSLDTNNKEKIKQELLKLLEYYTIEELISKIDDLIYIIIYNIDDIFKIINDEYKKEIILFIENNNSSIIKKLDKNIQEEEKTIELDYNFNKTEIKFITDKINSDEKYIFKYLTNYHKTNNGIIFQEDDEDEDKYIKGGESLCDIDYNECKDMLRTRELLNNIIDFKNRLNELEFDNDSILKSFVNNNTLVTLNPYENLKEFILKNINHNSENIEIKYEPKYKYNNCTNYIDEFNNRTNIQYDYRDYNKDIVIAYQKDYIDTKDNFLELIERQKEYIKKLTITKKRIVQDYTKYSCFRLYNQYKSSSDTDTSWFTNEDNFNFGDSYYATIYLLYKLKKNKDIHDNFIKKIEEYYRNIKKNNISIRDYISDEDIEKFIDIQYILWLFNDRVDPDSPFYLKDIGFDIDEWKEILNTFINNINYIIKNAPQTTDEIHCYRGSSLHYIKDDKQTELRTFFQDLIKKQSNSITFKTRKIDFFKSLRLSSYSLVFDVSFHYYNKSDTKNKCMYKVTIHKNCSVLYVAPLSFDPTEFELISPTNSVFIYNVNKTNKPDKSYNNIKRQYGIYSDEKNSFHTFYNILFFTPKLTKNEIEIMKFDPFSPEDLSNIMGSAIPDIDFISHKESYFLEQRNYINEYLNNKFTLVLTIKQIKTIIYSKLVEIIQKLKQK